MTVPTDPTDAFDETLLTAYLDNELTSSEREAVERQLHTSESKRKLLAELRSIREMIAQVHLSPPSRSFTNGPWNESQEVLPLQDSIWMQDSIWTRNWRRLASLAAVLAILVGGSVLFVRTIVPFNQQLSDSRPATPMMQEKAAKVQAEDVIEQAVLLGRSLEEQSGNDVQLGAGASQNREYGAVKKNEEMKRSYEPARSDPQSRFIAPKQMSPPAVAPHVASDVTNAPSKSEVEPRLKRLLAFLNASPAEGFRQSQVPGSPDASALSDYFMFSKRDAAKVLDSSNVVHTEGLQQIEILITKTRWEQGAKHLRQLGIPIAMEAPPDGAIDFDAIESTQQLGRQQDKTATVDTKELLADTPVYFDWEFKPAVEKPVKQEADRKAGENHDWIRVRFRVVP
jgi:hypothetical protein